MKPILKAICLFGLLLIGNSAVTGKPIRVLIDASKDGGLWWFPQAGTFNPRQYHQGKPLADSMRSKGWEVIEVPRGEVITFDRLRNMDIVVRPPAFFSYSVAEIEAYRDGVIAGTRLLLMGGSGNDDDALANLFGLRFEPRNRFASVRQWIPHPLTANIAGKDLSWTPINQLPQTAVQLAWLNQTELEPQPVLGYLPYGNGYVVFVGQSIIPLPPNHALSANLFNSLARYTLEELRQLPTAALAFTEEPSELSPHLLKPLADATLPQPDAGEWRFDWDDIPSATRYEIVVLGPAAAVPVVKATTTTSDYVVPARSGYVAAHNLQGWSWRVRFQYPNGTWSPWSNIRRFNVTERGF